MLTGRFLKVPTRVYNKQLEELTGIQGGRQCDSHINPMEICEYYPSEDGDEEVTQIYMKNGRGFFVYMALPEFEKLLNSFGNDR